MPLYDFHCPGCGHDFEALVRGGDAPACPHCGGAAPERLLSRPAPPAQHPGLVANARRAAAREGHFSHYTRAERARVGRS